METYIYLVYCLVSYVICGTLYEHNVVVNSLRLFYFVHNFKKLFHVFLHL